MNVWPKGALEHWVVRAKSGELFQVTVAAEIVSQRRGVETLVCAGYELWRVFRIAASDGCYEVRKPSVFSGGFMDDPKEVAASNLAAANQRLERDVARLRGAGVKVVVASLFPVEPGRLREILAGCGGGVEH